MKQLGLGTLVIMAALTAQAAKTYECSNSEGQKLNVQIAASAAGMDLKAQLQVHEGLQSFQGVKGEYTEEGDFNMLDPDNLAALLKISTVTFPGGQCGRCAGEYKETFAKLQYGEKEYDFTCYKSLGNIELN